MHFLNHFDIHFLEFIKYGSRSSSSTEHYQRHHWFSWSDCFLHMQLFSGSIKIQLQFSSKSWQHHLKLIISIILNSSNQCRMSLSLDNQSKTCSMVKVIETIFFWKQYQLYWKSVYNQVSWVCYKITIVKCTYLITMKNRNNKETKWRDFAWSLW